MNETDIAVKLEAHDHEIGSLKHRMTAQEEQSKAINDLVMSVQKLAINMEAMIQEQKNQNERLAKLEAEPADRWNGMKRTIFNTIVGAIAGTVASGLIFMMAQFAN